MKGKNYLKIILTLCLVSILLLPLLGGCGESVKKIGLSQVITHPALDAAREGILDALAAEGYVEGDNLEVNYQNSEGDGSLFASIAQQFVADKVDVIISIATPNSQAAIAATEGTDIPVVFTAVTDPVG